MYPFFHFFPYVFMILNGKSQSPETPRLSAKPARVEADSWPIQSFSKTWGWNVIETRNSSGMGLFGIPQCQPPRLRAHLFSFLAVILDRELDLWKAFQSLSDSTEWIWFFNVATDCRFQCSFKFFMFTVHNSDPKWCPKRRIFPPSPRNWEPLASWCVRFAPPAQWLPTTVVDIHRTSLHGKVLERSPEKKHLKPKYLVVHSSKWPNNVAVVVNPKTQPGDENLKSHNKQPT